MLCCLACEVQPGSMLQQHSPHLFHCLRQLTMDWQVQPGSVWSSLTFSRQLLRLQQGGDCLLCLLHHSHMVLQQLAQSQHCLCLQEHLLVAQAALCRLLLPAPAACMPAGRPAADKSSQFRAATLIVLKASSSRSCGVHVLGTCLLVAGSLHACRRYAPCWLGPAD